MREIFLARRKENTAKESIVTRKRAVVGGMAGRDLRRRKITVACNFFYSEEKQMVHIGTNRIMNISPFVSHAMLDKKEMIRKNYTTCSICNPQRRAEL